MKEPIGKLKHAYETIAKQEAKINELKRVIIGFLAIRDIIEYPKDTSEEHFGEALAVSNAISVAEKSLNL